MKRYITLIALSITVCMTAAGCSSVSANSQTAANETQNIIEDVTENSSEETIETQTLEGSAALMSYTSVISDTSELFSSRDLKQTADTSSAKKITVSDGKTIDITAEGVYIISGTAKNCTIKVNASKDAKVQLVLENLSITNESTPAIYVVSADKCFVTTAKGESSLSVTGEFTADGDTNTDAVIFSKDDIVLNGEGTLNITSAKGNGISGKDDLKITGGTYNITSAKDSVEAKDSVCISGGTFNIKTDKDAFHCENDEDDTKGNIYISGGTFAINAASDGIQGTTAVQIDGGSFDITASEGIEATKVQINDGTIKITASDDGINASAKSASAGTPTIEFNGGTTTIVMGDGDTDGVDVNGDIIVNGGTIDVTAKMSSFDYDGKAEFNGGTIIVNGEQVSEIPRSMMGGNGGMGGFGGRGNFGENGQMPQNGQMPNNGQMPQNGQMQNNAQMPENMTPPTDGERPNFNNGQMPENMTPPTNGERPDFNNGQMPDNGQGFGGRGRGGRRGFGGQMPQIGEQNADKTSTSGLTASAM